MSWMMLMVPVGVGLGLGAAACRLMSWRLAQPDDGPPPVDQLELRLLQELGRR